MFQAGKYQLFATNESDGSKILVGQSGNLQSEPHLNAWSSTEATKRPLQAGEKWLLVPESDSRYVPSDIPAATENRTGTASSGMPPVAEPTQTTLDQPPVHDANVERTSEPAVAKLPTKKPSFAEVADYEKRASRKRQLKAYEEEKAVREQLKSIGRRPKTSAVVPNAAS